MVASIADMLLPRAIRFSLWLLAFLQFAFPLKLHAMLDDTVASGKEDIISWQPHGKMFKIHKPKAFAAEVLPHYFKQIKYRSFQRQLHIYGFRLIKDKKSSDHGSYFHAQFIKGQKDLCLRMTREKMSNKGGEGQNPLTAKLYGHQPIKQQRYMPELRHSVTGELHSSGTYLQPRFASDEAPLTNPEGWWSYAQNILSRDVNKIGNSNDFRNGEEMFFEGMRFYFAEEDETPKEEQDTKPPPRQELPSGMEQFFWMNPAAS